MFDIAYKTVLSVAGVGIVGTLTSKYFESQGNAFLKTVADMGTIILVVVVSVTGVRTIFTGFETMLHLPKVWGF